MKKNYRLLVLLLHATAVYTTYSNETNPQSTPPVRTYTPRTFCSPRQRANTLTPGRLSNIRNYGFQSGSIKDLRIQRELSTAASVALQLQNAETTPNNIQQQ